MGVKRWERYKQLKRAKGWHWVVDHWEWFGNCGGMKGCLCKDCLERKVGELDDVSEALGKQATHSTNFEAPKMGKATVIERLTENNGWAIIFMHNKYFVLHLTCGTTLRKWAHGGCFCKQEIKTNCKCKYKNDYCRKKECLVFPPATPVDPIIYGKFRMMTLRDPDLKRSLNNDN